MGRENRVLRRQLSGRLRWDHAGRLWLAALSRLVSRRRWAEVFPVALAMDPGDRLSTLRFLIHDRDPVFTVAFGEVFRSGGLRILIVGERHLALVLGEYVVHYNGHRPHQSRRQRPADREAQPVRDVVDLRSVRRKPVVAGVINEYRHAA